MIRQTSIEVYKALEESGQLSAKRWEVYATVYNHGPMTSAEAFAKINENKKVNNLSQSRARFTELRGMGLLQEVGERECTITGHNVILWDVTDQLPTKLKKAPTKTARINDIVKQLEKSHLLITDIFERESVYNHIQSEIEKLKNLL